MPSLPRQIHAAAIALGLLLAIDSTPAGAQQTRASLSCTLTKTDFVYECTIKLARGGQPLSGARITVGADMPSMPMAHRVKPVQARARKAPGEYAAKLDLEMLGEWAVNLRLAGPVRERLVLLYEFDENGAQPVRRAGRLPRN